MISKEVKVVADFGFHCRPSATFTAVTRSFENADVHVEKRSGQFKFTVVDGKSIMAVLGLAIKKHDWIEIKCAFKKSSKYLPISIGQDKFEQQLLDTILERLREHELIA